MKPDVETVESSKWYSFIRIQESKTLELSQRIKLLKVIKLEIIVLHMVSWFEVKFVLNDFKEVFW